MINRLKYHWILFIVFVTMMGMKANVFAQDNMSTVTITWKNMVKDKPMELYDATYTNSFGEDYTINKFRYYISNIFFQSEAQKSETGKSIYLIDQAKDESKTITFSIPSGEYSSLDFQIGVDSIYNVSGAQTGPLDPTKDMFWTWNTGYVMAKLEGISSASKVVNGKYEFHIGGFAGKYNVLKTVTLPFPENKPVQFSTGKTTDISIMANADSWFQQPNDLKIADKPAINSPGKLALAMSENYIKMFTVESVTNHP